MALDHYIPQVHLRRFYSPALNGLLYAIRKSDLRRFTPRSQDVCRIDEGNTNGYLAEPRIIEEFLKTIEPRYNAAVAALESGHVDRGTIYVISGFAAYIQACSPAATRINSSPLQGTLEITAKILDATKQLPPPPKELGGESLTELLDKGKIKFEVDPKYPQAISIANVIERAVAAFGNFHWDILINENADSPFFSSDFPVAIELTEDPRVLNRVLPLTPSIAVRIQPNTRLQLDKLDFDFSNFTVASRHIPRSEAIEINRSLVRAAEDVVFFRDDLPWIETFVRKNRNFRVEGRTIKIPYDQGTLVLTSQVVAEFDRN